MHAWCTVKQHALHALHTCILSDLCSISAYLMSLKFSYPFVLLRPVLTLYHRVTYSVIFSSVSKPPEEEKRYATSRYETVEVENMFTLQATYDCVCDLRNPCILIFR